jgi:DNA sulfur modification protein DndD
MLRRATEAFLGIGGIDSLVKDLIAVERRAVMRFKDSSSQYSSAQEEVLELEKSCATIGNQITVLTQNVASLLTLADQAKTSCDNFTSKAKRAGLDAFENASGLKLNEEMAIQKVENAAAAVREALSDPLLPLNGCTAIWEKYKKIWKEESETRIARNILGEIENRDKRIIKSLKIHVDEKVISEISKSFVEDNSKYKQKSNRDLVLVSADAPEYLDQILATIAKKYKASLQLLADAKSELNDCQRKLAEVPQGDRLADLLHTMQKLSSELAISEANYSNARRELDDLISKKENMESKLAAASSRLGKDFRGLALHEKSIAAGQRARESLSIYKERLLASKAKWLSEMITNEFKGLMRKQLLVKQVLVDPESYSVSIVGSSGQLLPMERLSAGERQLLAVSVLSALIRERKGRFPVVVDTPLARLDRTHREALIKRFFAKVSHQVVVLSTDEEVHGSVLAEMEKYTSSSYQIDFSDKTLSSKFGPLIQEFNEVTA